MRTYQKHNWTLSIIGLMEPFEKNKVQVYAIFLFVRRKLKKGGGKITNEIKSYILCIWVVKPYEVPIIFLVRFVSISRFPPL